MFEWLAKLMDPLLHPLLSINPALSIFLISLFSTTFIICAGRLLMDRKKVEGLKQKSKELREKILNAQKLGNKKEVDKMIDELFRLNNELMKESAKTLALSILVALLFFPWLSENYSGRVVAVLPVALPIIGDKLNWIYWYVLVSLILGFVLNKLIGVSP